MKNIISNNDFKCYWQGAESLNNKTKTSNFKSKTDGVRNYAYENGKRTR